MIKREAIKSKKAIRHGKYRRVVEDDQRIQVLDPSVPPYSFSVYLETRFDIPSCLGRKSIIKRGSATLISENCLVTAGHCLFNERGEYASEVRIEFEMRQQNSFFLGCIPDISYSSATTAIARNPIFSIHPEYETNQDSNYDIAVITLNKPTRADLIREGNLGGFNFGRYDGAHYDHHPEVSVEDSWLGRVQTSAYGIGSFKAGTTYGWIGIDTYYADAPLKTFDVHMSGYPAKVRGRDTFNMHTRTGKIDVVEVNRLLYTMDTSGGDSGASICYHPTSQSVDLVGVHSGTYNPTYNYGTRLDLNSINFLQKSLQIFDPNWWRQNAIPIA